MLKTKTVISSVTISPITCSHGHVFYPKVLSDGTITSPDKCPQRNCRVYLDSKRVLKGIAKRELNLKLHTKSAITDPLLSKIVIQNNRPSCKICNIVFFDQTNLDSHNKRLHQQSY